MRAMTRALLVGVVLAACGPKPPSNGPSSGDAIVQMKKRGLNVVQPAAVGSWQKAAEQANAVVRGKVVPAAIYDEVKQYRDEYRAQHKR